MSGMPGYRMRRLSGKTARMVAGSLSMVTGWSSEGLPQVIQVPRLVSKRWRTPFVVVMLT